MDECLATLVVTNGDLEVRCQLSLAHVDGDRFRVLDHVYLTDRVHFGDVVQCARTPNGELVVRMVVEHHSNSCQHWLIDRRLAESAGARRWLKGLNARGMHGSLAFGGVLSVSFDPVREQPGRELEVLTRLAADDRWERVCRRARAR